MLNLYNRVHTFHNKMSYSTKNYVHMEKSSRIRRPKIFIFEKKHSDTWDLPIIELIEMVEKHNTLITMNYVWSSVLQTEQPLQWLIDSRYVYYLA